VSSKSGNNYGFLAAALGAEGILLAVEKAVYSHTLDDIAVFTKSIQKPIKNNVSLEDTAANHNAEIEAWRQAMAKKMCKAGNGKAAAKDTAKTK